MSAVDRSGPDEARVRSLLERLVAIDTQSPMVPEADAAALAGAELERLGFDVELVDAVPGRPNVIGCLENGPGPTFAFNTHLDVVPVGQGWSSDPFVLREADGRLYGRGSCDAKGPLAAMLEAMRLLVENRSAWSGTLLGVFVVDEEVASAGARAYVATRPSIDYCVIGEPTDCRTVIAHKGSLRPVVHVHGRTAHSGTPDRGLNAILRSAPLLDEIAAEHERIRDRSHPLVGSPTLTVVRINGGHADNVIPERCELVLDRRLVPGEDEGAVRAALAELVERASRRGGVRGEIVGFKPTTGGPAETPADDPVVRASQAACARHNGRETALSGFQGACDLVHFRSIGAAGVVLGPGSIDVAHQPDEFVPIHELMRSVLIYRDVAARLLANDD